MLPVRGGDPTYSLYYNGKRLMVVNETTGNIDYSNLATSGRGEHMNNPASQNIPDLGPVPQGNYALDNS